MTQFRPCIDLHNGVVKQIVGGTLKDDDSTLKTNFASEKPASYYAELYKTSNQTGGHVIQLGPGNKEAALSALQTWEGGLQIGGGITAENAKFWIDAGASHVIVTSYLFEGSEFRVERARELSELVGSKHLVLDLSCRKSETGSWFVATDRWQTVTSFELNEENLKSLEVYCDEFLVHAADVEGLQGGIDEELVEFLGQYCAIPVTYAGGARDLQDLELVKRLSLGRVDLTIGSALDIFGGDGVSFEDCVEWNKG